MFRLSKLHSIVSVLILTVFLCHTLASAQEPQQQKNAEEKYWKMLKGFRHGPNYFPLSNIEETKPLKEGELDFKHYHTYDEMIYFFNKWVKEYPDLLEMYVGGVSFEGREIYQLTLTNKKTGKDTDKPAMFIDANRHSGEVTAAESAFWMLDYMLKNYGVDPEITRLVDNFAFYFRPKNNPDGSLLYLMTAQTLRSTVRPMDNDGDGLIDEDPAEDLDGDGFIRQMRVKVPMGEGEYVIDERDPKGRLMRRVGRDEEGDYNVMTEGIDNDGDGRVNEDGVGGLDLHRNYPENWRPMTGRDQTERGWTQRGAGAFPLSETETRSLVIFLLEHPNISVMNTMDTTVPMHLRPPSTSKSEERMYPEDLKLYKEFDKRGLEITNYGRAGDVYYDYATGGREGTAGEREDATGRPLFGHSPDFGYFYYGSIWYGDELWNGGRVGDYDEDGTTDDWDKLQYNDKELEICRFQEWTAAKHPVHGDVEVGGWNPKFWRQNPPPELLEIWIEKQARFNLMLAGSLPSVQMSEPKIKGGKNGEYTIEIEVKNTGFIPTALKQAQLVKMVRPDMIRLEFPEGMVRTRGEFGRGGYRGRQQQEPEEDQEAPKVEILEPDGSTSIDIDRIEGGKKVKAKFKIKFNGIEGTECTVKYVSTRGGVVSKEIFIGKK